MSRYTLCEMNARNTLIATEINILNGFFQENFQLKPVDVLWLFDDDRKQHLIDWAFTNRICFSLNSIHDQSIDTLIHSQQLCRSHVYLQNTQMLSVNRNFVNKSDVNREAQFFEHQIYTTEMDSVCQNAWQINRRP